MFINRLNHFKQLSKIVLARGFKLATGLLWIVVIARSYGVSQEMDQWVLYFGIVSAVSNFLWGPVIDVFRIRLLKDQTKPDVFNIEQDYFDNIIWILLYSMIISGVFFTLLSIISSIMSSFEIYIIDLNFMFIFLLLPYIGLNASFQLLALFANTKGYTVLPDIVYGLSQLLCAPIVFYLADDYGILILGITSYLLVIFPSLLLTFLIIQGRVTFRKFHFYNYKNIFKLINQSKGLYIPFGAGQVTAVCERTIAFSNGDGYASLYNYTNQVRGSITSIFQSVFNIFLVSYFSKIIANHTFNETKTLITNLLLTLLPVFLLLIAPFYFISNDIIVSLFRVTDPDLQETGIEMLNLFLFSVYLYSINSYVNIFLLSHNNVTAVSVGGALSQACTIASLFYFQTVSGIPLSIAIGALFGTSVSLVLGHLINAQTIAIQILSALMVIFLAT